MIEILLQAERALEMGRVDAAETLYRQVADADPRNSIAVVGLARVTLERGDEAGALQLARRALVIDPENAAASRMVERLEEVIRYRGAEPPAPEAASAEPAAPRRADARAGPGAHRAIAGRVTNRRVQRDPRGVEAPLAPRSTAPARSA